ncbi:retinol-binding protein 3 [Petromyzon marinus]|uniref:retinol-binding protein 3 n=1 Tax=Petromyzon marinus TaxID=7757 RepID=UPI003F715A32
MAGSREQRTAFSTRLLLLLLLPLATCPSQAPYKFDTAVVLHLAKVLLDNYCIPENLVGMDEAIQRAVDNGELLGVSDPESAASALTEGIQAALNDPRIAVSYVPDVDDDGDREEGDAEGWDAGEQHRPTTFEELLATIPQKTSFAVLDGNVGYLRADEIISEATIKKLGPVIVQRIWNRLVDTDTFVLDLRYNSHGDITGLPYLVSCFCEPRPVVHLDTVYYRPTNESKEIWSLPDLQGARFAKHKDVFVLVSANTEGVAENVAYVLKHLHRATVIGEQTAGGSLEVERFRLGDSRFFVTVPTARSQSPLTGRSWELTGVFPCVSAPSERALDKALEILNARGVARKAVEAAGELLLSSYTFVERASAIADHLSWSEYGSVVSVEDLTSKLTQDLQSVAEDPRLVVSNREPEWPPLAQPIPPGPPAPLPDDEQMLEAIVDSAFKVEVLEGNIGYLRFDEFGDASAVMKLRKQLVSKVWERIHPTDDVIIDLRYNLGGSSTAIPIVLSYFQDASPPVHFYTVYDRLRNVTAEFHTVSNLTSQLYGSKKGVYLLTSQHTATAAEEFTYLMQSLNRATIVGEITSGRLAHSLAFRLSDTGLYMTVPIVNFIDNNDEYWLGGGVVPDAIVLAENALDAAKEIIEFHAKMASLLELAGALVEGYYAMLSDGENATAEILLKYREGWYRSVVDYEALASQLTSDLHEIWGDHRLHAFYSDLQIERMDEDKMPSVPSPEELSVLIDTVFKVDILANNVGYLRFDMMTDAEVLKHVGPQLVEKVWNKISSTRSLVIDVRYNMGGYSTSIPILCSYFFDASPPRHLYTVFDRPSRSSTQVFTVPRVLGQRYGASKDVYILTSHMTGSAGEILTRVMSDLKRATVIGEPTAGGSLSTGTYRIGDSRLYVFIPNQAGVSPSGGRTWSVAGVEPHVQTKASEALQSALRMVALRADAPSILRTVGKLVADGYSRAEAALGVPSKLAALLEAGEYGALRSEEELAFKLTVHLQLITGDRHLKAVCVPEHATDRMPGIVPMQMPPTESFEDLIKFSFITDVLEGNIGYLRFDLFSDLEALEHVAHLLVEHVWKKICDTEILIIDLRYNVGGPISSIPTLASYLFDEDQPVLLDSVYTRRSNTTQQLWTIARLPGKRYGSRKPVLVLTSRQTLGAAEEFAAVLKRLGRALLIGETTGVGCLPPHTYHVDGTHLYLAVPGQRSLLARWERTGVSPHVPVAPQAALLKAKQLARHRLAAAPPATTAAPPPPPPELVG